MAHFHGDPARVRGRALPALVYRNVLGAKRVAAPQDYIAMRRAHFRPAVMRDRKSGKVSLDRGMRDCPYLNDLGPFEGPIRASVDAAAQALKSVPSGTWPMGGSRSIVGFTGRRHRQVGPRQRHSRTHPPAAQKIVGRGRARPGGGQITVHARRLLRFSGSSSASRAKTLSGYREGSCKRLWPLRRAKRKPRRARLRPHLFLPQSAHGPEPR
jgi:hypothetical protein